MASDTKNKFLQDYTNSIDIMIYKVGRNTSVITKPYKIPINPFIGSGEFSWIFCFMSTPYIAGNNKKLLQYALNKLILLHLKII